jgi:hypothetical protein
LTLVSGCGDDEEPGDYLDRCSAPQDCDTGLSCKLGRCAPNCMASPGAIDDTCAEMDAVCANRGCFPACSGGLPCPGGLVCKVTTQAGVQACQPPDDEIPMSASSTNGDFGNAPPLGADDDDDDGAGGAAGAGAGTMGGGGDAPEVGQSGLSVEASVTSLSTSEAAAFCEWARALPGVGTEMDCGDGVTVLVEVDDTCESVTASGCDVTVGQAEACLVDSVAQACVLLTESCQPLLACLGG